VSLLICIQEVPSSILGRKPYYLSSFYSIPPGKYLGSTLKQTAINSLRIVSSSLFCSVRWITNHILPTMARYTGAGGQQTSANCFEVLIFKLDECELDPPLVTVDISVHPCILTSITRAGDPSLPHVLKTRTKRRGHTKGTGNRNTTAISENCYQTELNTWSWIEQRKLRKWQRDCKATCGRLRN
jgi:hypothetical protein